MAKKIKLGTNASQKFSIPVSVPREVVPPKNRYDVLDVKQFVVNSEDGLIISDEQFADMQANTDIDALVAGDFLVVETV